MNVTTAMKNAILFVLLFLHAVSYGQILGCTDPGATNLNPAATVNNGSCEYAVTNYTPIVRVDPLSDSLIETSGLQMAGGYLWSFNDRGGKPALYRIDTSINNILQRVILSAASNTDWEALAFDGTYFYVGDFGNNQTGGRTDLRIYKFPFSAIQDHNSNPVDTVQAAQIELIHFTYSDQPQPVVPSGYNNSRFDCEAMIVHNNKIHLFSKNWVDNSTTHYFINSTTAGSYTATPVATLATGYLVTAAAKVPGQNIICLLGYQNSGTGKHFLHILSDYKADSFFTGNKRKIDLPDATVMGQSEGICFRNGKYGYISNEKFVQTIGPFTLTVNQKLRSFDLTGLVGNYFTQYVFNGNGNWSNANNWLYKMPPPLTLQTGNEIIIDPVAGGNCTLDIPYTMPQGTRLITLPGKQLVIQGNLNIQ
jgi:hypothetical protein